MTTIPKTPSPLRQVLNILVALFLIWTGAYALSIDGFLLLRFMIGERWWIIALFNSFIHLMVLPALILLPLVLILAPPGVGFNRQRKIGIALLLVPAVIATLIWYAPGFLSKNLNDARALAADSPTLSVLSFNITSGATDVDEIADLILGLDADVVALQELSIAAASMLQAQLSTVYPYDALVPDGNSKHGAGIFSRFPILDANSFIDVQNKVNQRAEIDFNNGRIVVYNLHLIYPFGNNFARRAAATQDIMSRTQAETLPVILLGDFNMTPQSEDYAQLIAAFNDAFMEAGSGTGFTYAPVYTNIVPRFITVGRNLPLARIDYIFYSDGFSIIDMQVIDETAGSDHHPVFARFGVDTP
ncbi:MAG: endonuclease/exonuclease/phosphatase family protein [Chitinophagaceae bacterium]|nr:endonuclease/exonuclease/phosphatase family protein [Anaerolineae bacterium]